MKNKPTMTRQEFMNLAGRGGLTLLLGGTVGALLSRNAGGGVVWQLDPAKCIQCGQCATHCVLDQSAVRCFHEFQMCGYCELCTGFFNPQPNALNEGAENQACPAAAIRRSFVEDPYYQYEIDEAACIGCALCVKGCVQFGNGSLYLQVRQDICVHCNECAIAAHCPADAWTRLPADQPYVERMGGPVT
jgi:electron transport complex protein RnfB